MRGKIKIGTSALLVCLIAASLLAFVPSAFAASEIEASTIEAPLLGPGELFTVDITARNFANLWYVSFVLEYDTSILNAMAVNPVRGSPALLTHIVTADISTPGVVMLTADRATASPWTPSPSDQGFKFLIGLIDFEVVGRGVSTLHFSSAEFQDNLGGSIPVTPVDGEFDNRYQGVVTVPTIFDTGLPGNPDTPSFFDVFFDITAVLPEHPIWGYRFTVSFDPSILMPVYAEGIGFEAGPTASGFEYMTIEGTGGNLATDGAVAKIGFAVVGNGVTLLTISDTLGVDIYGNVLVLGTSDGSFANADITVRLDRVSTQSWWWSLEWNGPLFTLKAKATNTGGGLTKTRAHFLVYDWRGAVLASLGTDEMTIMPGETLTMSATLDLSSFKTWRFYLVRGSVEYMDEYGDWVLAYTAGYKWYHWYWQPRTSLTTWFLLFP